MSIIWKVTRELDFGFEHDAGGRLDPHCDLSYQTVYVGCLRSRHCHEEVGMALGNGGTAHGQSLQASCIDDSPRRISRWVLEHRSGVEGSPRLMVPTPAGDLFHPCLAICRVTGLGGEGGGHHDFP